MSIQATAGSKLFIGTALASRTTDFAAADFASQVWTEIGWTENLGTLGDSAQQVPFDGIGQKRRIKRKGTRDGGTMSVVCGQDALDAGQIALIAAEKTDLDYAFKIQFDDAPLSGSSPKPSTRLFVAMVMSASEAMDTANSVRKLNATLDVNSNIVRTNASAS